ncbi:formimidoylglutamase [Anaerobacillus alkaliphilus]|uniref:Formimidoylglutamase n=1 Tax=Anaerobacillus alkaliphilus TaxID=1548597 RepID=A0A4Q0VTC7_9BACI|nr:formimidoylglutamase [Anaerobacillus alkaliphilus]RXJ00283.1 formimidoylglutamase [Anaerobacillus alkaliphilus]
MSSFQYLKPTGSPFVDRHVTRFSDIVKPWNEQEIVGVGIVGAPLSKSSISHSGAHLAPSTIRKAFSAFTTYSIEDDCELSSFEIQDLGDIVMHVTDIVHSQDRIYKTLSEIYATNRKFLPIILGGDNSITYPSIKAFSKAKGRVGVIQFDAHHDVRNLEDGGTTNGTPFRSLLESNTILGENLVQIGIRDFSNSKFYRKYVDSHGVTVFTMKNVRERRITEMIDEALQMMKGQVDVIYVSLDMDVVDQAEAPGCPAIGPGGMSAATLIEAITYLGEQPKVQGLEIVEIDPTVDFRDMTSRLAAHVILHFLKGKARIK